MEDIMAELHPMHYMAILLAIIVVTLGFTPPSSVVRIGVLPALLLLAYMIVVTVKNALRTTYASTFGAFGFCFTLQFLVMGLIEKWSFEAGGPASRIESRSAANGKVKGKGKGNSAAKIEGTFWNRLKFGCSSLMSFRDVNTPYEAKGIPSFSSSDPSYVPSRAKFLMHTAIRLCVFYLVLDFIEAQPSPPNNEEMFAASKVPVFSRLSEVTIEEVILRITSSTAVWTVVYSLLKCMNSFAALLGVASGLSSPKDWKPWNGSIGDAYTLRGFWGNFWHQATRKIFNKPSIHLADHVLHLPPGLVSRYSKVLLTFTFSGLLHVVADYAGGMPMSKSGSMEFFFLQGVGVIIEDSAQALWRMVSGEKKWKEGDPVPVWKKVVGYIWMMAFLLFWSSPIWFWPQAVGNDGGIDVRLCPRSVVDLVLKKVKVV